MNTGSGAINIDFLAAKHAQSVVCKKCAGMETTVTKAIGVLQEHGVYATFLYLLAKEAGNGTALISEMIALLHEVEFCYEEGKKPTEPGEILSHVNEKVSNVSLHRLIFAKELLEQMLIYIRYGEKASAAKKEHGTIP